ncbi:Monocyte Differentiation Antigen Cd14 [Manis pentadactyla]|nr:Monocyte Differentiation Antigen Cd14 [Manis pentadactyla]
MVSGGGRAGLWGRAGRARAALTRLFQARAPDLLLLLLLLPPLLVSADAPEPCAVDDDDVRCVCNFTAPQPDWSSAFQCMTAVEVEIRGGGRSLGHFLKAADVDSKHYAGIVRSLRLRRLTVGAAQIPAPLLGAFLRALGYSRLKQLALEDLDVTGTMPPPPLEAIGPALSTLSLRNVSWAAGGAWLAQLQQWLKPGLQAQRQRLQEQHQIWIQEELKRLEQEVVVAGDQVKGLVAGEKVSEERQRWHLEQTVLRLQLGTLQAERNTAEQDLVFRAWRELLEEQAGTTEHRYRSLLAGVLQDTINLATQNQQLQQDTD